MPFPELAFAGTRRFWAVREQYDTPAFRAHCKRLAAPVAAQIRADLQRQARVVIVGIDGSPSMGVELTASSREWGGRPDKPRDERALASVAALGLICTAFASLILYRMLVLYGSSRTSLVTYLIPPMALFYGFTLLGEEIHLNAALGLVLIFAGVALGSGVLGLRRDRPAEPAPQTPPT